MKLSTQHLITFGRTCQDMNHMTAKIKKLKCRCPTILKLWLLVSTFRALVYKLLIEFEQQLIFTVCRVNPGSLCSKQQSSTAEDSLAEAGRPVLSFRDSFFDILKCVQQSHIV